MRFHGNPHGRNPSTKKPAFPPARFLPWEKAKSKHKKAGVFAGFFGTNPNAR
jgi:hypothetical protein